MSEKLETCPNCQHPHHLPGTECATPVAHGPNRWHLCLCLARPGAAAACPPQMTCQGGTLGYGDIWYLQHGHSLSTPDGVISPDVLTAGARSFSDAINEWNEYDDQRDREKDGEQPDGCSCGHDVDEHSVYGCADGCGCEWMPRKTDVGTEFVQQADQPDQAALAAFEADLDEQGVPNAASKPADQNLRDRIAQAVREESSRVDDIAIADAVLAILPAPADRAAVLREAIAVLDQRASRIDALSASDFGEEARAVRELADAANDLRRMADEAQQPAPRPPITNYVVEIYDADEWLASNARTTDLESSRAKLRARRNKWPDMPLRIVRSDETYTVVEVDDPQVPGCAACEAGIAHDEHCPTPESHNAGCGCPTDTPTN